MSEDLGIDKEEVERLRREYKGKGLHEDELEEDPMKQFAKWFQVAVDNKLIDSNAMTLSTADSEGRPSTRVVLLKGFDERGFIFYTNYKSRKSRDMDQNPYASLCFYWKEFERQIRIRGTVERLPKKESEEYFKTRPRDSQIGAWASIQSAVVDNREQLEEQYQKIEDQFEGEEVPLPDFWGGYVLSPAVYEFWQGRMRRMHDRIEYRYSENQDKWIIQRLSP